MNAVSSDNLPVSAQPQPPHIEDHIRTGNILKPLVYGGLDGSINTLIIVLTGIITSTPAKNIMGFCIAATVGDGIGMGLGDYLSARAEI